MRDESFDIDDVAREKLQSAIDGNKELLEWWKEESQKSNPQIRRPMFRAVELTPETRGEMEKIKALARLNGTYLKAPNGADTKLTPEQWAMVRTKAFKDWFGNWEGREFLLSDRYVSQLAGNEFEKDETPITEKVAKFYKEKYDNKVARDGIGIVVLDARSVKDSIAHGLRRNKAAAFAAVPDVIKSGIEIDRQRNWKGRGYDSVTIAAPISINGEGYVAVVILTQSLNSNRFYLHEVALQENLQDEGFKTGTKAGLHQGDIANVLRNFLNTSKVVDENGEPMVVYHGTISPEFYVFDNKYVRQNNELGVGFYFADAATAKKYLDPKLPDNNRKGVYLVYETFIKKVGLYQKIEGMNPEADVRRKLYQDAIDEVTRLYRTQAHIIQAFLNIRKPLLNESVSLDKSALDAIEARLEENRNDGIIDHLFKERHPQFWGTQFVVFSPNQIKSATENNGEFSRENDDIRFRTLDKTEVFNKIRNSKVAAISGDEIDFTPGDDKGNKKKALDYGKRLQGTYINADTGLSIQLQRGRHNGGLNEVLKHDYKNEEHIKSIAAIPQLIENGILIAEVPNEDKSKNPTVSYYQHYVCGLKIGDSEYTVHALIAVDAKGDRYYDHNLISIEKENLLNLLSQAENNNGFGTTPDTKSTTVTGYKFNKLISILQSLTDVKARITPAQDAEYQKAYEDGDEAKAIEMLDAAAIAAGYDTKAFHGTEKGFNVFQADYRTGGNFFTPQEDAAKAYANAQSFGKGGVVIPVYLNLGKTFEIDAKGSQWDEVPIEWEVDSQKDDYDEFFDSYSDAEKEALKHQFAPCIQENTDAYIRHFR